MENYKYQVIAKKEINRKLVYKVKDDFIRNRLFYIVTYKTIEYSDWELDDKIKLKLKKALAKKEFFEFFDEGNFISNKKTFYIVYDEHDYPNKKEFEKKDVKVIKAIKVAKIITKQKKSEDEFSSILEELKNLSLKEILQLKNDDKEIDHIKKVLKNNIPESLLKHQDSTNIKIIMHLLKWVINPESGVSKVLLQVVNRLPHYKKEIKKVSHAKEFRTIAKKRREFLNYPFYKLIEQLVVMFALPQVSIAIVLLTLLELIDED